MSLQRRLGSPGVALVCLILPAVWPVVRAGYPSIGDGLNHFYRLVEFDHLLRGGVWFPRWATDLGYGYGYPLFNFYPPLVYYLGVLFHALGPGFAHSLLAVYVLSFGLAITGAYGLALERWGERGGLIAACAYGLAPYLYFNSLARGALPETLALGLLPWVLWAFARLARQPSAGFFLIATLLYAGLILSHLLSALLAIPLLFVFALISVASPESQGRSPKSLRSSFTLHVLHFTPSARAAFLLPASFFLAICLSSFFLLPSILETRSVQLYQLTTPGDLDFHNNFLTLSQLFSLPRTFDPRLVFIAVPPSLSLMALALALPGLALNSRQFGIWELGVGISFVLFSVFTLPLTVFAWERLPFASLIQFPWRLVGPASLLLALLAASAAPLFEAGPSSLPSSRGALFRRFGFWILDFGFLILLPALFFYSLTWTFAPRFDTPPAPTVRDLAAYEATGQLGATSAGEFLPRDVHKLPDPDSLRAQYAEKTIIDRLAAVPASVTLISQSATLTSATATVEAQSSAALTFNFFYFPGWSATVDGKAATVVASDPNGLITVPVESGRHTVTVRFGSTPLRTTAAAISFVALLALAVIAFCLRPSDLGILDFGFWIFPLPSSRAAFLLPATALALLLFRATRIDGRDTLFSHSRFDGAVVSGVGQNLDVNFENQLVLIGRDRPRTTVAADESLPLTLYWRAQNPPDADYSTTVQVVDEWGNIFGQSDSQNPGRTPTSRWSLGQYAQDYHRLTLLPGTPPGAYRLITSVYQFGGAALDVLDENQVPQGQSYRLGLLTVTRAARPPAQLDAAQSLNLALGPLTLLGQSLNTTAPLAGDELRLTLFWRTDTDARPDLKLRLELTAANGVAITSMENDPARSDYPTSRWASGEVVRAPLRLRIPATAQAGAAILQASLISSDGARIAGPSVIAALDLRVPERSFSIPAISHPRGDKFGGAVKLLGYDLTPEGLTLYWQALAAMDTSYTVFVHALTPDDHILAQVDSLPLNGARPTLGWLPGEVLTDLYALPLTGAAKIEIGLYNVQDGERLGVVIITP